MVEINFYSEDIDFTLDNPSKVIDWIERTINEEGQSSEDISVIFCSDNYILNMNREYLQHDYFTDIITFDYSDEIPEEGVIAGDLFISIDTVSKNANDYSVEFKEELKRVIIHGVLHLLGYKDSTDEERNEMRSKENYYLQRYES